MFLIYCEFRRLEMRKLHGMTTAVDLVNTFRLASARETISWAPACARTSSKNLGLCVFSCCWNRLCFLTTFGNWVIITFLPLFKIGCCILCSVVFQSPDERNYHIFYQLCTAADADEFIDLHLGRISSKHNIALWPFWWYTVYIVIHMAIFHNLYLIIHILK